MSDPLAASDQPSVLAEIRRALGRSESSMPPPPAPAVLPTGDEASENVVERFIEEATAVLAQVHRAGSNQEVAELIAEICRRTDSREVALSGAPLFSRIDLASSLARQSLTTFDTSALGADEREELISRLAGYAVGITAIDCAVAETGTIVLSSDEKYCLLVSLLPPVHIAIMQADQIKMNLAQAVSWLSSERMGRSQPCSANFITGPSRTGDVELTLSVGVHGPKELHLIVLGNHC